MLSAIGGGLGRDLLTGEIPVVLRREIYAVAALAGAVTVVAVDYAGITGPVPLVGAAVLVFVVRLIALRRSWSAPVASDRDLRPVLNGWRLPRPGRRSGKTPPTGGSEHPTGSPLSRWHRRRPTG